MCLRSRGGEFVLIFMKLKSASGAQYEIFLESYSCHGKNYFTDGVRLETLAVEAGKKVTKEFSVDVRDTLLSG